ncbi:pyridoxal 5'-phosphate synthase glutaminase subunit PdxT [bacterium]|nr:pyridoxal 5'-phosphate synthase glutaminase subunit PdxT [bacterium]
MSKIAGILALQGDFAAHAKVLATLGVEARLVRRPDDLSGIDWLVLPGGESTTMSLLLDHTGLRNPLRALITGGMPTLATCAGVILLAQRLMGDDGSVKVQPFGLLDATVDRNAFGRQADSFEAGLIIDWHALGSDDSQPAFRGVFIRAPRIATPGAQVQIIGQLDSEPVLVRQGNILAATFHPELSGDSRLHAAVLGFD